MSTIEIKDIWQIYDGRVVLEKLNLSIEEGSFVSIVGPSGCGKTTLLRMLMSEEFCTRGSIQFDGTPLPARAHAGTRRGVPALFGVPASHRAG